MRKSIVSGMLITTLCCGMMATAADTRPFSVVDVSERMDLTDAELVTLRVPSFEEARDGFAINVPINGDSIELQLAPHSLRSERYVVRVQHADGSWSDVQPGEINTFRGTVANSPGTRVAASLTPEDGFKARIMFANGSTRWIESLATRFDGAGAADYVTYRGADIIPADGICGTEEGDIAPIDDGGGVELGSGDCGGLCVAELGCDADVEYYVSRGSSVTNVENRINQIMNLVNLQYENETGITHELVAILVRTAEPDPYSSTNSNTLVNQLRSEWLINQGAIQRDVAHLWTGKNINGSTIGQAFTIGGICTTSGYAYSQAECCGSTGCAADLVTHELGHLWAATHISDGSTMSPSITCSRFFSSPTESQIINHRNTRNCLDPFDPGPPPGAFSLIVPSNNDTAVPVNVSFDWGDSSAVETYTFMLDDDPTFATPLAFVENLNSSEFTPLLPLIEGKTYFWQVTAFNQVGEQDSNPTLGSFTTIYDCDGNGLDDAAEIAGNPDLDCNNNNVIDACDISGFLRSASADEGPISSGNNQTLVFSSVTDAVGDVSIRTRSLGDLNFSTEFYDVEVNGVAVGSVFDFSSSDCTLVEDTLVVPANDWNTALGGGDIANIEFIPTAGVGVLGACPDSYVFAEIAYDGTPTSADANMNDEPDECESGGFPLGDMNCDGIVSVGDIAGFVLALTDPAGYAAQFPDCDINNADINMDTLISVGDIGPFVALLTK